MPDDRPPKSQLRLIRGDTDDVPDELQSRVERDYRMQRAYREIDTLIYRVLQLHDILEARFSQDEENARIVRRQIWAAQKRLDRVFNQIS